MRNDLWVVVIMNGLRDCLLWIRLLFLRRILGMDIHPNVEISLKANLDLTNRKGIHIGEGTRIAFGAAVLAHDALRNVRAHTYIGKNCALGCRCVILPGVTIGDHCVIGAGAVVIDDVPPFSTVFGNPARVMPRQLFDPNAVNRANADAAHSHPLRMSLK
jgi:acetyltransferase-like isoleucine patch superfamily enzyme